MPTWGQLKKQIDQIISDDQKLYYIDMDFKSDQFGYGIDPEVGAVISDKFQSTDNAIKLKVIEEDPEQLKEIKTNPCAGGEFIDLKPEQKKDLE